MKKTMFSILTVLFAFAALLIGRGISSADEFQTGTIALYGQSVITGWDTLEASRMIGAQLLTTEGDYLGQISDLVIDSATGHIVGVVLSDAMGRGTYDRGNRTMTVPFAAVSHTGNGIYVFNKFVDFRGQFSTQRPFLEEPFTQWDQTRFLYSVEPVPSTAFDATALMGSRVQTPQGEQVARMDDFVIDFSNDRVVYAVLTDVGGTGGKMVAVPFTELSKTGNTFTLHTTKERLVNSPSFQMADMNSLSYAANIYGYYGVQPYWEER